ncbi:MAG TPA: anthranilate phosphoribosyltransferase [Kofleriaceae bacterium]|jgi:anthranilate phosphoribosyltransferase
MTIAIDGAVARAAAGRDLSRDEVTAAFGEIMDGAASADQVRALLVALRDKGETVDELVGAATAMRARATPLACPTPEKSIDTCGTGGDGAGTVNISTLAAIVVAACGGAVVAKHGNRAQSSRCGSADVLEALGVNADVEPAVVERCIKRAGIGFAFAPRFHAATRHAAPVRKAIGTRTIFNLLGPLTNPARVRHQVVGVFDRRWCEPMAAALGALGVRRAAVVHGADGLDELAVRGDTFVAVLDGGAVHARVLRPGDFGLADADPAGLAGGDAAHNAGVSRRLLAGEPLGAVVHAVAMTAALALALVDPGPLELGRLPERTALARAVLADSRAAAVLERWIEAAR